jgi:hypothetical protein
MFSVLEHTCSFFAMHGGENIYNRYGIFKIKMKEGKKKKKKKNEIQRKKKEKSVLKKCST